MTSIQQRELIYNPYRHKSNTISTNCKGSMWKDTTSYKIIGKSMKRSLKIHQHNLTKRELIITKQSKFLRTAHTLNTKIESDLSYFYYYYMQEQKSEWTDEENIKASMDWKQKGNEKYSQKDFKEALRCYHKAILHTAGILDKNSPYQMYSKTKTSEQILKQCSDLKFSIYMNMGQIYIFQQKYQKGVEILTKANLIKTNAKLHYRRGVCYMNVKDFDRAKEQFRQVLHLDQTMKGEIEKIYFQMSKMEKVEQEKQKKLYQKFFK